MSDTADRACGSLLIKGSCLTDKRPELGVCLSSWIDLFFSIRTSIR